ncbi:membrane protein [Actinoplanes sp. SE50]|nr:hypothetical protein ACPL_2724 [Actinoplanes sp. SE50/110]ATO82237.1 membrane protein [Actinoplanes sp. SE50]SLL99644.1 membrane protein [Actinoplanes sp. SE50/110]
MAQAVIMLLLGGAVVKATVTDTFLRYVKEGLRPYLLIAGVLLIVAAVMTMWYELRAAPPAGEPHDDGHGQGHGHHEPTVGWLLLLPVLGLLLVSPPALGSFAAGQTGSVGPAAASDYPPLAAGDPIEVNLLDYASRAIFDSGRSLAGRTIKLTGFITPGPDGRPMIARIVLTCCAADGRPIKVGLTGVAIDAPPDAWVQVVGVYSSQVGTDPVNRAPVAYLEVKTWQEIDQPKQPYT